MELAGALGLFFGTAVVVVVAARALAASGDVIAFRTGWGRVWVGTLLLAGATSLPELVTTATAVRLDTPDLAAGNIFGSNMINNIMLAVLMALCAVGFAHLLPDDLHHHMRTGPIYVQRQVDGSER